MEDANKVKFYMTTHRRLNIEYQIQENLLKQTHLINIRYYQSQENIFNHRKKNFEYQQRSSRLKKISDEIRQKNYQFYLDQQIVVEHEKQIESNQHKQILLKQFDELKHTINDPHSTLSALAALSRSLHSLEKTQRK